MGHEKNSATGGCAVAASTTEETRNRVLVVRDSAGPSEAKVFRAQAPPPGACGVCLSNQQTGRDSLWDTISEGFAGTQLDETHE